MVVGPAEGRGGGMCGVRKGGMCGVCKGGYDIQTQTLVPSLCVCVCVCVGQK